MTRSGYLPRVQDRAAHLSSGLDLVCSGQYLIIRYFPHPVRGHLKPHISPVVAFFSVLCSFSGTVGATTISIDQMPWHGHTNYNRIAYGPGGNGAACNAGEPNGTTATGVAVIPTGGSAAHGHTLTGTVSAANSLPPYYTLAYIMRVEC